MLPVDGFADELVKIARRYPRRRAVERAGQHVLNYGPDVYSLGQKVRDAVRRQEGTVKEASRRSPIAKTCHYCKAPVEKVVFWCEHRAYIPACAKHLDEAVRTAAKNDGDPISVVLRSGVKSIEWMHERRARREGKEKHAQVDAYQQKTDWTCSAACLKAVMAHWGKDVPELLVIQAIGAKKGRGAETTQIVEAAKKFGFDSFEMGFDSMEQAQHFMGMFDQNVPLICDIQSFNHPGKGHYVVLTSLDEHRAELMDPNTPGNQRSLSVEEMEERWWDRWMAPPHEVQERWAIVIAKPGVLPHE